MIENRMVTGNRVDCLYRVSTDKHVGEIFHLNEFLYSEAELDTRKSGEKQAKIP